jgi:cystathionine beta-synthase
VLELIGDTPLVKLERLMKLYDLPCELFAKCEFFNAGGSVKDRIGLRMIEEAERSGRIKPGDVIIEPTSGNTGIGLCLAAAIKGYKMIVTMPEKMSAEKVNMMRCLGAEIIRSPDEARWDSPESHIGIALKLAKEIPNAHILDQYKNPANPLSHYEGTGAEILKQLDNQVHAIVIAAGTGGTLTGIARKMKDTVPQCKVIAVDPVGSILAQPECLNDLKRLQGYQVEGIGYDFIPTVLDRAVVDEWVKVDDIEAFKSARELIRHEALLCGGSSGSNLAGALKWIKAQPQGSLVGKRVVTIMPDSSRNYMSKFIDDAWMLHKGFLSYNEAPQSTQVWSTVKLEAVPCVISQPVTLAETVCVTDAISFMGNQDECAVVDPQGTLIGSISVANLLSAVTDGRATPTDSIKRVMDKKPEAVFKDTTIGHVAKMMQQRPYVFLVESSGKLSGIVTRKKLLNFVLTNFDTKENRPGHKSA